MKKIQIILNYLFSFIYFIASVAATAPSLVAVTSCLRFFVLLSPATNMFLIFVLQSSFAITYPCSFMFIIFLKFSVSGTWPIAINSPSIFNVCVSLLFVISILSSLFSPFIFVTVVFSNIFTFCFSFSWSNNISSALKVSLLCIR